MTLIQIPEDPSVRIQFTNELKDANLLDSDNKQSNHPDQIGGDRYTESPAVHRSGEREYC